MGIGFAANSVSMKCSPAYLQDEMLFHLPCLHIMQSISVFSSFMTSLFDTLALERRFMIWNQYLLGGYTYAFDITVLNQRSMWNVIGCLNDICNQNISCTQQI